MRGCRGHIQNQVRGLPVIDLATWLSVLLFRVLMAAQTVADFSSSGKIQLESKRGLEDEKITIV